VPRLPCILIFGNQRYVVDKDQFIIGRGTKSSDLPIRDGNISRKHAAVIRRNGEYYIKDLGSTNGIDYKGERIEGKKIEEGRHLLDLRVSVKVHLRVEVNCCAEHGRRA
jgi:pSer/pThr/pTyr-binding forkhead associated (FHA) protein